MKGYIKLRRIAQEKLENELPQDLFYHSIHHTMDVLKVCNDYVRRLEVDPYKAKLLRIGALYHDIGFTVSSVEHEERGAEIAETYMRSLNFSSDDISIVKGLIRATKIPQNPKTELEKIICDADLDYLGKDNYFEISHLLFKELTASGVIKSEAQWHQIQISFLESHEYHTPFAREIRQPVKEKRLMELKESSR